MVDNRPVLFDAIEFSDAYSCIDVLYDLAFLLMDLDRHGLRDQANTVLNRYLEVTGDHCGLAALPLFLSCRAAVRAHTALAASEAVNDEKLQKAQQQTAAQLLERAVAYLAKMSPRLLAIGGVSGTGKTTLARDLAPFIGAPPGAVIIRSDIIRKQLMGVVETDRLSEAAYTPAMTTKVYDRITELARVTLSSGYSVIADAVFGKESERRNLAVLAKCAGASFDGLWLEAPSELLKNRINSRIGDASDATIDVLRAQLQFVFPPQDWVQVSAALSADKTLGEARRVVGC
jgi:predicted kinase